MLYATHSTFCQEEKSTVNALGEEKFKNLRSLNKNSRFEVEFLT